MSWQNPYIQKIKNFSHLFLDEHSESFVTLLPETILARSSLYESCILEPCSGSGKHLLTIAQENPRCLVIGIEKRFKRAYRTLEKGIQRGIENIFLIRGDIKKAISLLPENKFSLFFLNFPDPWDKRRWEKYQILDVDFLTQLKRMSLASNGVFRYKTDHYNNFLKGERLIEQQKNFVVTKKIENVSKEDSGIITEFELLWRSRGKPIYLIEANIQ